MLINRHVYFYLSTRFIDDKTDNKICLENVDKDLSIILQKKHDELRDENLRHMFSKIDYPSPRFNEGKPIRLGIVKLADERKDIESSMLFICGACESQKIEERYRTSAVILQFYHC